MPETTSTTYKKSDFMTASQIAKKFGLATEEVVKLIRLHIGRNVPGKPLYPILVRNKISHNRNSNILLHPLGRTEFEKIIQEYKNKGK